MEEDVVAVIIGGDQYTGWKKVTIHKSQEQAVMEFRLSVSEPDWSPTSFIPFIDETIEILVGEDLVMTAVIDGYEADAEGDVHNVEISGRTKGADAVDSHAVHPTGRVKGKTLLEAANEFAKKTGIDVKFTADVKLKPIPKIQLRRGDTVFDVVEREARKLGLMIEASTDGNINLTKPQGKRHAGALIEGQAPFKKAKLRFSRSGMHSKIHVRGQRAGGVDEKSLRQEKVVEDKTVKRTRTHVVHVEGDCTDEELKRRGDWHKRRQHGKGVCFSVTVDSWRDEAGKIWTPGLLMAITAPLWHIDGDLLLQSAVFDEEHPHGKIAVLEFVDPRAHGGKAPAGKTDKAYDTPDDDDIPED